MDFFFFFKAHGDSDAWQNLQIKHYIVCKCFPEMFFSCGSKTVLPLQVPDLAFDASWACKFANAEKVLTRLRLLRDANTKKRFACQLASSRTF